MPTAQIHYQAMKALLAHTFPAVDPACPFSPLLQEGEPASWEEHRATLRKSGILQRRKEELHPAFKQGLEVLASPRRRFLLTVTTPQGQTRLAHFCAGEQVVLAGFDHQEQCFFTTPHPLDEFVEKMVEEVGFPSEEERPVPPLPLDARSLMLLGELLAAGLTPPPSASPSGASAPLSLGEAQNILARALPESDKAEPLLQAFLGEDLLTQQKGQLWVSAKLQPWLPALLAQEKLEFEGMELPEGEVPAEPDTIGAVFLGPPAERTVLWPTRDPYLSLVLARPNRSTLRSLLRLLVGQTPPEPDVPGKLLGLNQLRV